MPRFLWPAAGSGAAVLQVVQCEGQVFGGFARFGLASRAICSRAICVTMNASERWSASALALSHAITSGASRRLTDLVEPLSNRAVGEALLRRLRAPKATLVSRAN